MPWSYMIWMIAVTLIVALGVGTSLKMYQYGLGKISAIGPVLFILLILFVPPMIGYSLLFKPTIFDQSETVKKSRRGSPSQWPFYKRLLAVPATIWSMFAAYPLLVGIVCYFMQHMIAEWNRTREIRITKDETKAVIGYVFQAAFAG